jgi:hypothetical protein
MPYPQVISTDRHILQGWVDLADVRWDPEARTLQGTAKVIGGEPFKLVVANNGNEALKADAGEAEAALAPHPSAGLSRLTLFCATSMDVDWVFRH